MATLIFIAFSALRDLYYLSPSLDKILSIKEAIEEIQRNRNTLLFSKYRQELWDNQFRGGKLVPKYNTMETGREAFEFLEHERGNIQQPQQHSSRQFNINYSDIEVISAQEEIDGCWTKKSTFFDLDDPDIIYENHMLGEIREGVSFIVSGTTLHNCERFSINLILDTPSRDIALHFNPRLPQNYIVRNSKIKNVWSTEEIASIMPFALERGKQFTIQILITDEEYLISVNGHHFTTYSHRLPYLNIKCLEVKGDVKDIQFEKTIEKEYPKRTTETMPAIIKCVSGIDNAEEVHSGKFNNSEVSLNDVQTLVESSSLSLSKVGLRLPYYAKLPEKFQCGQRINIEGRIKILPHSFFVNLQSGNNIWPHPTIPFHLNPRFAVDGKNLKHIICKNSWTEGKWNQEERNEITNEFAPGRDFSLGLCAGDSCYEVYLNEKFIANYQHRIDERKVDTIYIQGDVHIWNVTLVTDNNLPDAHVAEALYSSNTNTNNESENKWV